MFRSNCTSTLIALAISAALSGCVSSGVFTSAHLTNVELSEANYRIVATDVTGEAEAAYLFGFSGSIQGEMQTWALARLEGEGLLYREALENLWSAFESDNGPVANRSLALVNVRYDADAVNILGVYTRPRVSIRADVVEFGE